jgi:hypothetical protein
MWIEKHPWSPLWFYGAQVVLFAAVSFLAALAWTDAAGAACFAAGVVAWGVFLRTVLVWHITWSVNSLTHIFGYRNHDTGENSRNNWLVALFACGEGWHNNHHADPACCTVRHRWWELDVTYLEVRALGLVGLAWDVVPRREDRVARVRATSAQGTGPHLESRMPRSVPSIEPLPSRSAGPRPGPHAPSSTPRSTPSTEPLQSMSAASRQGIASAEL